MKEIVLKFDCPYARLGIKEYAKAIKKDLPEESGDIYMELDKYKQEDKVFDQKRLTCTKENTYDYSKHGLDDHWFHPETEIRWAGMGMGNCPHCKHCGFYGSGVGEPPYNIGSPWSPEGYDVLHITEE